MAAVAMCIVAITFPLVLLQRYLLQGARKYATIKGKAGRMKELPLGPWAWPAAALLAIFIFVTVIVPVSGIALRAFVTNWGFGVNLSEALTLESFRFVFNEPTHTRAIWNTVLIGTVGGALTVACYTAIGFASHRRNDGWSRFLDYLVLVPRAVPGLLAGLAFLWVFLFFPPLTPLRTTIFSVWLAYSVVWLAYGMRLISSSLMQVSPELEEAGRSVGASRGVISRRITLPLIRAGLMGSKDTLPRVFPVLPSLSQPKVSGVRAPRTMRSALRSTITIGPAGRCRARTAKKFGFRSVAPLRFIARLGSRSRGRLA
jgi:iron(III) transport system permease protein